ncbi:MAG: crotonobetainyl-CoA:carnitine CoA-transferase CaiB-like acyl-CoA transferase, partial [Janthinobacterium sp.]
YDAQDGPLVVAVGNNGQFVRFCNDVIDRADIAADERFKTNLSRITHRDALMTEIRSELGCRTRKDLLERMSQAGIPCGEVAGLHEALTSRRATESELVATVPHPEVGSVKVLASPYRFDGERLPVRSAPPQLGEGTMDVLQELLGLSDDKVTELKGRGVC